MLIMPFHPTQKEPMNAYAYPVPGTEPDSYAQYSFMMTPFKLPNGVTIEIPSGVGTGKGSMVYLDFHPATWRQRIKNTGGIAPGTGPGEVLFTRWSTATACNAGWRATTRSQVTSRWTISRSFTPSWPPTYTVPIGASHRFAPIIGDSNG